MSNHLTRVYTWLIQPNNNDRIEQVLGVLTNLSLYDFEGCCSYFRCCHGCFHLTWRSCCSRRSHSGPSSTPRSKMTSSVVQEGSCNRRAGCGSQQCCPLTPGKEKQSLLSELTLVLPAGSWVCCLSVLFTSHVTKTGHSALACLNIEQYIEWNKKNKTDMFFYCF